MSNFVFALDTNKRPLDPVHPAQARTLLTQGKAAVFRRFPFTIILKTASTETTQPIQLKIDPGSQTTGIALVSDGALIWGAQLTHRGQAIKDSLLARKAIRRNRRNRKTRYRRARFLNRTRKNGWLAPSLEHRVKTTLTWVNRLIKFAPITGIFQELVRFDTQALVNPEISGTEYQRGELAGFEVKEYLLAKWGRKCAYCGGENTPLQIEHILAKSKGGTDRVSNLALACHTCNQKKGNEPIEKFLSKKPDILKRILAGAKAPLKDAAAVNSTRWELYRRLQETGLPVEVGTGGRTKFNRVKLGIQKSHYLDAACVGAIEKLILKITKPLLITAKGWGNRQMATTNKYGFPITHRTRQKAFFGFQTGDIVRAILPTGKKAGTHIGRLTVRASGVFEMVTIKGKVSPVRAKYCQMVHRVDGYSYAP
ncbi:RNA-guided endonuclease IscB [Argonema antarcticum]|uniref:RNA-guided endonuclease IscB n=1 Tax=Argonema antarcticum TaxID=2942763 RepID=UPI002010ED74|nr:RNA-guided endonuclease IscB [Argonema antarcticum]MCL1472103.1 HNH endonuclease [Argonema antarcticum A004/B2]